MNVARIIIAILLICPTAFGIVDWGNLSLGGAWLIGASFAAGTTLLMSGVFATQAQGEEENKKEVKKDLN